MIGTTISHYRITAKLGEGGMGVVYKAEDTKLDRPVALKFLAAHLVSDEGVRKRFEREAKAAAALNHPNICTVHEIDEFQGKTFIAMAFLEGEALDKRIEAGPLKLNDALDIATQTAKGLQAAHSKGIVHRDIKPANMMIGGDGQVTIMDFGLAQLADRSKLTRTDETMGTVSYMSPEQTYGAGIDHRSDIWSLGVVIYEMVVGEQPFKGHYDKAVMYSITSEEPEPMTTLRTGVPMELELLANKCLAKDADRRYQGAAELIVDLETLSDKLKSGKSTILPAAVVTGADAGLEQTTGQAESPSLPARRLERRQPLKQATLTVAVAIIALLVGVVGAVQFRGPSSPQEMPVRRFSFTPDHLSYFGMGDIAQAMISPSGKHIAYVAGVENSMLWIRDLDREEPREIEGTEGARFPSWSPDSELILFAASGEVRRVSAQGGAATTICQLPQPSYFGGSYSPDGTSIVFSSGGTWRLYEVPARGGTPRQFAEVDWAGKGPSMVVPRFLPSSSGGRTLLYAKGSAGGTEMFVWNLETGEPRLLGDGFSPVYSPTGHIVYETESGIWALPFSLETLSPTGEAFPILQDGREPSVSDDGTLVYTDLRRGRQGLIWLDRQGKNLGVIGQPQPEIRELDLSPDGRRVVVHGLEDGNIDVWVHDVERPLRQRVTFHSGFDGRAIWGPSDEEVTFHSTREGYYDIYTRRLEGTGEPTLLKGTPLSERPGHWSSDGKHLLYQVDDLENGPDLWRLERKRDGGGFDSIPFLQTSFSEIAPRFSLDGRFVVYQSDKSGRNEIYVRAFPGGENEWQVSADGGGRPRWSQNSKEIFYVKGGTLVTTAVSTEPTFTTGTTTPLFQHTSLRGGGAGYDVSADGQRFVVVETLESEDAEPPSIRVVQNWFAEFKDRR